MHATGSVDWQAPLHSTPLSDREWRDEPQRKAKDPDWRGGGHVPQAIRIMIRIQMTEIIMVHQGSG